MSTEFRKKDVEYFRLTALYIVLLYGICRGTQAADKDSCETSRIRVDSLFFLVYK